MLVVRNRYAVEGAKVTFEPEEFLGGFPTYQGTTNHAGAAAMQAEPPTPAMAVGLYRVTIEMPDGEVFARGVEVADDAPGAGRIEFQF